MSIRPEESIPPKQVQPGPESVAAEDSAQASDAAGPVTTSRPATTDGPPPEPKTLDWYLARIPTFPPAPPPQPVTLSHEEGRAAKVSRVPTSQPVIFITIDDGWWQHELTRDLLLTTKIPVAPFLTWDAIKGNPDWFASTLHSGMVVSNHTLTHPELTPLTYDEQCVEIGATQDLLEKTFGHRPTLFRPPFTHYNDDTLRAAWEFGISILADVSIWTRNGQLRYYVEPFTMCPGDIILMHYDENFPDDFLATLLAAKAAGLTPALLTDYLTPLQ